MNIYDYIKSKYLRLSKGQRKVAQFILEQPSIIPANIASEVGRLAGVSESTVIRFCYAIELGGYNELQEKLAEYLTLQNTLSSPKVIKKITSDEVKGNMIRHAQQISEVVQKVDTKQITMATQQICNARKIFIAGFNKNTTLAQILHSGIEQAVIIPSINEAITASTYITKEDVLILFDDTVEDFYIDSIITPMHEKDLNILFIHDQKQHPLRKKCKYNVYLGGENALNSFGVYSFVVSLVESVNHFKKEQQLI